MEGTLLAEKIQPPEGVVMLKKATVTDIPVLLELEKIIIPSIFYTQVYRAQRVLLKQSRTRYSKYRMRRF